jgi:hypothetical protein
MSRYILEYKETCGEECYEVILLTHSAAYNTDILILIVNYKAIYEIRSNNGHFRKILCVLMRV